MCRLKPARLANSKQLLSKKLRPIGPLEELTLWEAGEHDQWLDTKFSRGVVNIVSKGIKRPSQ